MTYRYGDFFIMDEELKAFIEENIELIDSKQFKKLYDNFHKSKIASWMLGEFTQGLWDADIHPELYMNELPLWFTHTNFDLKKFTVPSNIIKIGDNAFGNCQNLEELIISEGVKDLGDNLCNSCENLRTLSLPKSLEKIGEIMFFGCRDLGDKLEIIYHGTAEDFSKIIISEHLMYGPYTVHCLDKDIKFKDGAQTWLGKDFKLDDFGNILGE